MNTTYLVTDSNTGFAITALKNAYEKCSDKAAREAILSAFNAINLLQRNPGTDTCQDETPESDSSFDASELCAAV